MCVIPPTGDTGERLPSGTTGNALTGLVRRTAIGSMVDGGNRDAFNEYATREQMAGRRPLPYNQWLMQNRHAR